jgi:hypothetical protein
MPAKTFGHQHQEMISPYLQQPLILTETLP